MDEKNWFKKHADTIVIVSMLLGGFLWVDGKFEKLNERLIIVERDLSVMKAVMLMKNILPAELAKKEEGK